MTIIYRWDGKTVRQHMNVDDVREGDDVVVYLGDYYTASGVVELIDTDTTSTLMVLRLDNHVADVYMYDDGRLIVEHYEVGA